MATESESATPSLGERSPHLKSVVVTMLASFAGIGSGVASDAIASSPTDTLGLATYAAFTFASLLAMRLAGVDVGEFGLKDNLYVFFMAFSLWFITWGILLTSA